MSYRQGLTGHQSLAGLESGRFAELDRLLESLGESEYEHEIPSQQTGGTTIVSIPPNAKVFVIRGFAAKSGKLLSQHGATLRALTKEIVRRFGSANQVNRIQLTGHAADAGRSLDQDLDFGLKRARAVRKILEAFFPLVSLTSPSFKVPTYQECSAGATQPDSSIAADNRRVVITLL